MKDKRLRKQVERLEGEVEREMGKLIERLRIAEDELRRHKLILYAMLGKKKK